MTKKLAIIIFSALILLAVLFAGFYLFFKRQAAILPKQNPPTQKLTEIQVANWKVYQNKDFSFKYPADWHIISSNLNVGATKLNTDLISNFPLKTASVPDFSSDGAVINIQNGAVASSSGKLLDFATIVKERFVLTQFNAPEKIMLGTKSVLKYTGEQTGYSAGWNNYLIIPYDEGLGNYYEISFAYNNSRNSSLDYPGLFAKIMTSFIFTK